MPDQVPPATVNTPPSTPVGSGFPVTPSPQPVQPSAPSNKGMMMVVLAAFLVVAVLMAAGIYTYMMMRETNPAFQQVSENVQQSLDSAANDLSGVNESDIAEDFAEVDKELNQL